MEMQLGLELRPLAPAVEPIRSTRGLHRGLLYYLLLPGNHYLSRLAAAELVAFASSSPYPAIACEASTHNNKTATQEEIRRAAFTWWPVGDPGANAQASSSEIPVNRKTKY